MAAAPLLLYGPLVHSIAPQELVILSSALLVVAPSGRIHSLHPSTSPTTLPAVLETLSADETLLPLQDGKRPPPLRTQDIICLLPTQFLMPGFVDTHNHAPQAAQRGLGQDTKLLAWLEDVVFTTEARFADADHARAAYDAVVRAMLRQGITTAAYYGSLHSEATRILVDACLEHGQRALVGKCNMDRGAPEWYRDADVEASLQATRECIAHVRERDPQGDLVKYVVTPRFAISCSGPLLEGLGKIAAGEDAAAAADDDGNNNNNKKAPLPIQTHFAEAAGEIRATLSLFPEFSSEAELYASFGLLTPRTVLAHCTRMSEAETARVRDAGCGIAHCPTANMTVGGGFMAAPVAKWLRQWGMEKVGLGTDIGGGFAPGMLDAMRHARIASCARAALDRVAAKATLAGSSGSSSSSF
jgi:guanine deaminase